MTPTVVFVGADKGGVGKTMLSRILLDYLKDKGARPTVYDSEGALNRFYGYARPVDITFTGDQLKIFDGIQAAGLTVVDMRAGSLSQILRTMRETGRLDKSDAGKERLIVLHVLGSSKQSMDEIVDVNAQLAEGGEHILVENHADKDGSFFKWDEKTRSDFFRLIKPELQIEIPHLDTLAAEDVDRLSLSFTRYIANSEAEKHSDHLSRIVKHWRDQVYPEFDKIRLA